MAFATRMLLNFDFRVFHPLAAASNPSDFRRDSLQPVHFPSQAVRLPLHPIRFLTHPGRFIVSAYGEGLARDGIRCSGRSRRSHHMVHLRWLGLAQEHVQAVCSLHSAQRQN